MVILAPSQKAGFHLAVGTVIAGSLEQNQIREVFEGNLACQMIDPFFLPALCSPSLNCTDLCPLSCEFLKQ